MENWAKWTWTELYRDYVLPTNKWSKNVLIASLLGKKRVAEVLRWKTRKEIEEYCKDKLGLSKSFALCHGLIFFYFLYSDIENWDWISISTQIINILCNLYPVLVQIDKHQRVGNILRQINKSK